MLFLGMLQRRLGDLPGKACWLLVLATSVGCAGVDTAQQLAPHTEPITTSNEFSRAQALERHFQRWRGTPYHFGGTHADGIDCSGFVHVTYARLFARRVPRATVRLRVTGRDVSGQTLAVGDLVFFSIDAQDSHVGIYTGNGTFIHASTSRGVVKDRLDSPYWSRRYSGSVRILSDSV